MKKINSIDYGGRIIGIGSVFLFAIPVALHYLNIMLCSKAISIISCTSVIIGALIEIGFFILLFIELWQDRIIDSYYQNNPLSLITPQQVLDEYFARKKD